MGRVHGEQQVMEMLSKTPNIFRRALMGWLWKEIGTFIGTKKMDGIIRRDLKKRKRWIDSRGWESKVVNLFSGKVVDFITGKSINMAAFNTAGNILGTGATGRGFSMMATTGLLYKKKRSIHGALEFLEEGGTIHNDKYMPIPVKGSGIEKAYPKFKNWLRSGRFNIIYKNGLAYYFLQNKLMYVGMKMVKVMFAHRFTQLAEARKAGINIRAGSAVDKAVQAAGRA